MARTSRTRWAPAMATTLVAVAALGTRRRTGTAMLAGGALIGAQLGRHALEALRHESVMRRARHRRQAEVLRELARPAVVGRAHDPLSLVLIALEDAQVDAARRASLDRALADVVRVAQAQGSGGRGLAGHVERRDGPLNEFGRPEKAGWAPARTRGLVSRLGGLLDEIRLLHTSDIEHATLLYTLAARALIVGLAPSLRRTTAVPVTGAGRVLWAIAATWSASIAVSAPDVATLVMDRTASGTRARRTLLRAEVPIALTAGVLAPSWTVAVFSAGWTNYWQRPGPAFYPKRLIVFVAATGTVQAVGLARAGVPGRRAAGELALTLAVLGLISNSYGAMLPLSAATVLRLLLDGEHEERAERYAHDVIEAAVAELRALADALAADGDPRAAAAAQELRTQAQVLSEGPPAVSRALPELVGRALERAPERLDVARPTFSRRELRTARLRSQPEAEALAMAIAHCLAEAVRHGRGRVLTDVRVEAAQLVVTMTNERAPAGAGGLAGAGRELLAGLVTGLPGGVVLEPGSVLAHGVHAGMWRVRFACDLEVLE